MIQTAQQTKFPRIVIVGSGFGGLTAARRLANARVRVTLVDRNNYHVFDPLLYQVASALLSPSEISFPIRTILRHQSNADFRMTEVTGVDLDQHRIDTANGPVEYDYLVLAFGGRTNYFGMDSLAANAFGLKDLHDAARIRDHLLTQFERASQEADPQRRRAMLTFVIAGGGPTGVEMAGALSELFRLALAKDFVRENIKEAHILLLEASQRLLPGMPDSLAKKTVEVLQRKGVEVRFGAAVSGFDKQQVSLRGGESIPSQTLIWTAGVRSADLVSALGAQLGPQQRVRLEPTLQLPGHPEVFVIGDTAYGEDDLGQPLPMVAPVAIQMGESAADNLIRLIENRPLLPFRYRDPGQLATIGRNQAVVRLGRFHFSGFFAWLLWIVVHIYQLIGVRNRLVVLVNWAWDYFLFDRAIRSIGT